MLIYFCLLSCLTIVGSQLSSSCNNSCCSIFIKHRLGWLPCRRYDTSISTGILTKGFFHKGFSHLIAPENGTRVKAFTRISRESWCIVRRCSRRDLYRCRCVVGWHSGTRCASCRFRPPLSLHLWWPSRALRSLVLHVSIDPLAPCQRLSACIFQTPLT